MNGADYDAIIAGGGVIGASTAWRLAAKGLRVLLADARTVGSEASSAGAGMLAPGGEFHPPSPMFDFAVGSLAQFDDFVAGIQDDSGLPVEFRRTDAVQIALTDSEFDAITQRAASQRAAGVPSRALAKGELRSVAPLVRPDAVGAIHYANEAIVDTGTLMPALRAACLARGVTIQEESPVTAISASATGVSVSFGDRTIDAAFAVLAAGAWSSGINVTIDAQAYPLPRSFPVKGHLLGYRQPPGSLATTVRHDHTYVLQRAGGFTIAGSSTEDAGFDRGIDPKIVSDIGARAGDLVPALRDLQPESVWIGFRPATDAPAPNIGRVRSSRLWLAYGHYRNGVLLAPATSHKVCEEISALLP